MSNNCLVTKYKSAVNNDNLEYLGYKTLHLTFPQDYNVNAKFLIISSDGLFNIYNQGKINDIIEVLTPNVTLTAYKESTTDTCSFFISSTTTLTTVRLKINKYKELNLALLVQDIICTIEEIIDLNLDGLNLNKIVITDDNLNGIYALKDKLKSLYLRGLYTALDFNLLSEFNKLETLVIENCNYVNGDLSAIKDLPNISYVQIKNTSITDNNNTVAYLQNRGVTITYQ